MGVVYTDKSSYLSVWSSINAVQFKIGDTKLFKSIFVFCNRPDMISYIKAT